MHVALDRLFFRAFARNLFLRECAIIENTVLPATDFLDNQPAHAEATRERIVWDVPCESCVKRKTIIL